MRVGNDEEMRNGTQLYVTPLLGRLFKSSNIYANCFTPGCVVITDNATNFLSVCERQRERWMLAITHPDALPGLDWWCQSVYRSTCKWSGDLTGCENILYDS